MVKLRMKVRGGFVLAVWASLAIFLLAALCFIFFSTGWWVWLPAALSSAACFIGFPWGYRFRDVTVGDSELRIRAGRSFRHVRRLPRKFVTGCSFFASPLQRALGICCVVVYTPGSFAVLIGLGKDDGAYLLDILGGVMPR